MSNRIIQLRRSYIRPKSVRRSLFEKKLHKKINIDRELWNDVNFHIFRALWLVMHPQTNYLTWLYLRLLSVTSGRFHVYTTSDLHKLPNVALVRLR